MADKTIRVDGKDVVIISDAGRVHVRNDEGKMVELTQLLRLIGFSDTFLALLSLFRPR